MRRTLLVMGLTLLMFLPSATASVTTPEWTVDVGPGYITTSPVGNDDHVFIRTSGFWTGEERPQIMAIDHQGEVTWSYTNPTSTQHDMAPLLLVTAGQGPCGTWPDLLLVGWADGQYTAHHPENGSVAWSVESTVDGWGITGRSLLDGDHVVVPLRNGMARYCLADGSLNFQVELGLGWRNGVSATPEGYWMGDEQGTLWLVNRTGVVAQSFTLPGSLRHSPLVVGNWLLMHVQTFDGSELMGMHVDHLTVEELATLGPSPAVPLAWNMGGVFGDSHQVTSVLCSQTCEIVSSVEGHVNGEMAWASSSTLYAPMNTPEGGWMVLSMDEDGTLNQQPTLSTPYDGFGTSAPLLVGGTMYLGNDAGVLMALAIDGSVEPSDETSLMPVLGALVLVASFASVAALATKVSIVAAWRWLSVIVLSLALVMLPSLSTSWNTVVSAPEPVSNEQIWNASWPDTWLGTQVVVFEFEDESLAIGGLVGHQTVLQLTEDASETLGLSLTLETTALGVYLEAINGTTASGWEYFIDGQRGQVSVDVASVDSTSVLVWRLA